MGARAERGKPKELRDPLFRAAKKLARSDDASSEARTPAPRGRTVGQTQYHVVNAPCTPMRVHKLFTVVVVGVNLVRGAVDLRGFYLVSW